jgi:hypothetical protein
MSFPPLLKWPFELTKVSSGTLELQIDCSQLQLSAYRVPNSILHRWVDRLALALSSLRNPSRVLEHSLSIPRNVLGGTLVTERSQGAGRKNQDRGSEEVRSHIVVGGYERQAVTYMKRFDIPRRNRMRYP